MSRRRAQRQSGAALLCTLMLLSICMLLGAATANMTLMNEKAARNNRDHEIAFQAAEAALADALQDLRSARGQASDFPQQPGTCDKGLCLSDGPPAWTLAKLDEITITYGSISARRFAHGSGTLASQAPRYLIELLRIASAGKSNETPPPPRYRITAIGYGPQPHNRVLLQTIHAIDVTAGPSPLLSPGQRLSWRDLSDLSP